MSAGDLLTGNNQVELGDGGLLIGEGTSYRLTGFNPFTDVDRADFDSPRALVPGINSSIDFAQGRKLSFSIVILGTSESDLITKHRALTNAMAPRDDFMTMAFQLTGSKYFFVGRPRMANVPSTRLYGRYTMEVKCRFLCTSPYYYDTTRQAATFTLTTDPTPHAWEFPARFPAVFDNTAAILSTIVVNNAGNAPAAFTATITGVTINPYLKNNTTGGSVGITGSDIGSGQTLLVDSYERTLTRPDGTNLYRFINMSSTWFSLSPGNNTLEFTAANSNGSVTVYWYHTYI